MSNFRNQPQINKSSKKFFLKSFISKKFMLQTKILLTLNTFSKSSVVIESCTSSLSTPPKPLSWLSLIKPIKSFRLRMMQLGLNVYLCTPSSYKSSSLGFLGRIYLIRIKMREGNERVQRLPSLSYLCVQVCFILG